MNDNFMKFFNALINNKNNVVELNGKRMYPISFYNDLNQLTW